MSHLRRFLSLLIAAIFLFTTVFPPTALNSTVYAKERSIPTPQDIYKMMTFFGDPQVSDVLKRRMAAFIFVHQDIYRRGVVDGIVKDNDENVQAFLRAKSEMQMDVVKRMNANYRNDVGKNLDQPIVPFGYNNIMSDDDIITGAGSMGRKMEGLYVDALDQIVRERANRPMSAADRHRVDVNGLAWDMTVEGGIDNYWNKEKYLNPQSGYANLRKLQEKPENLKVIMFDADGNMKILNGQPAKDLLELHMSVEKPLNIPNLDETRGVGSMSDFMRMAEIHKVDFSKPLTKDDIIKFIRNQKYTDRLGGDFDAVARDEFPDLARQNQEFSGLSKEIRNQTTALGVAEVLERGYGIKIVDLVDGHKVVDFQKLAEAMAKHQEKQLKVIMPALIKAVSQNEAFKIVEWLKSQALDSEARKRLKKRLALTYAAMDEKYVKSVIADINKLDLDETNKAWLAKVMDEDAQMIRDYAKVVGAPPDEFTKVLSIDGDSVKAVDWLESVNNKVTGFANALDSKPGGKKFKEFLRSKTAKALNLDVMLDGTKSEKIMSWSILLLAASRAYNSAEKQSDKWKAMGMACFEMIPFVASALRFSEMDFKEGIKELAMDVLPPLALAAIAVAVLNYAAQSAKSGFQESVWDRLVAEALLDLTKDDFEKTDTGYYRLKDRESYLNYLEEVAPGFGRIAKLASMVAPEVDALMSQNTTVRANEAALYTLQWLEKFDQESLATRYVKQFDLEQLKSKVWEEGLIGQGQSKTVERVAAAIILDNLRIRALMYRQVLDQFIDRIERRFNKEKGVDDRDCETSVIGSAAELMGSKQNICDPSAIIDQARITLKQIYEQAQIKVKDSNWAANRLQDGYKERLDALLNYNSKGKTEIVIRQDMQAIIDDFRVFIKNLLKGMVLYEEYKALQLQGYVYGGAESFDPAEKIVLGDEFRLGASALVQASRANSKWTVYYYFDDGSDNLQLLGQVILPSGQFNPGGPGLWPIKHPEKKTFLAIKKAALNPRFSQEASYTICPVLALGNWSKDPISQVGLYVLRNPEEFAEFFDDNRVAYAGTAVNFNIVRPKIEMKWDRFVYKNENVQVSFSLKAPKYLKPEAIEAELSMVSVGASQWRISPQKFDHVSVDAARPSMANIYVPAETKSGNYEFKLEVKIKDLAQDFQPIAQIQEFEYTQDENPQEPPSAGPQAPDELSVLLAQMQDLVAQAQGIMDSVNAARETVKSEAAYFLKTVKENLQGITELQKLTTDFFQAYQRVSEHLAKVIALTKEVDQLGKSAGTLRQKIEKHVASCCEASRQIKSAKGDPAVFNPLIKEVNDQQTQGKAVIQEYKDLLAKIKAIAEEAKAITEKIKATKDQGLALSEEVKRQENVAGVMDADLEGLNSRSLSISEAETSLGQIKAQAQGIIDQVQTIALENLDQSGKKKIQAIKGLARTIDNFLAGCGKYFKETEKTLAQPREQFSGYATKFSAAKSEAQKALKNTVSVEESLSKAQEQAKDVQASYDAVEMYREVVDQSGKDIFVCGGVIGDTQDIVASVDCSAFQGTKPRWTKAENRVDCACDDGWLWDEDQKKCRSHKDYDLAHESCGYANSEIYWDDKKEAAQCRCKAGYEWNNSGDACRVASATQVSQADCSMYAGSAAQWDNQSESVHCECQYGSHWEDAQNACIADVQPGVQDSGNAIGNAFDQIFQANQQYEQERQRIEQDWQRENQRIQDEAAARERQRQEQIAQQQRQEQQELDNLRQNLPRWIEARDCLVRGLEKHNGYWMDCNDNWTMGDPHVEIERLNGLISDAQSRLGGR